MKRWLSIGILAATIAGSSPAWAQAAEPTAAVQAAARERFERGVALFDKAEFKHDPALYEAALIEYQMAYTLWPRDNVLWNRALCELELKRYVEALAHFKLYDQHLNVTATPSNKHHDELRKYLAEANAATGHITIQAAPGALVQVDGARAGNAPLPDVIDVLPGAHRFEAGGHRLVLVVAAGTSSTVSLLDEPPPEKPPVAQTVVPTPIVVTPPSEERSTFWTTGRVVAASAVGVSAASLVAAVAFGQKANSAGDRARASAAQSDSSSCVRNPDGASCQSVTSARDDQTHDRTASKVFQGISIAGIAVAAGALIFPEVFGSNHHREHALSIVPALSPTGGGLSIGGDL